jgi:hypothetical protein
MRRKVHRLYLKAERLKVVSEADSSAKNTIQRPQAKKMGRPTLSASTKYKRAREEYESELEQLKRIELENAVEHIDIADINDPALDVLGGAKVGRPAGDKLTAMDAELLRLNRKREGLGAREVLSARNQSKLRRLQIEILLLEEAIAREENELDDVGRQERIVKRARDSVRLKRLQIKKAQDSELLSELNRELLSLEAKLGDHKKILKAMRKYFARKVEVDELETLLLKAQNAQDENELARLRRERAIALERKKLEIQNEILRSLSAAID